MRSSSASSLLGRLVAAAAQFCNRRGVYLGRRSGRIHVAIYRWSAGRLGGHVPGWPRARILLLHHAGARSGIGRTSPLIYYEFDGGVAVAASNGGQPANPAWFHNLKAHPVATIQTGSVVRGVRARLASREEHAHLWPEFVALYSGYEFFQQHATDRQIPIFVLEPIVTASGASATDRRSP